MIITNMVKKIRQILEIGQEQKLECLLHPFLLQPRYFARTLVERMREKSDPEVLHRNRNTSVSPSNFLPHSFFSVGPSMIFYARVSSLD